MKQCMMLSLLSALIVCVIIATVVVVVVMLRGRGDDGGQITPTEVPLRQSTGREIGQPTFESTALVRTQSIGTTTKSASTRTTVPPEPTTESSTTSAPTKPRTQSIGGTTTESTSTTATVPPEPTTKSSTTTSTSTKPRPEPTDAPTKLSCLTVADFYNFDLTGKSQTVEYRLINDVAEELFPNKDFESMGIWIYGHSRRFLSIDDSLNNMYANLQDFEQALWDNDVIEVEKPLNTSDAIKVINKLEDARHRANCLIFLSAQQDTSTLPRLDPSPSRSGFQRIVAIGFNETDLQHVVVQPQGVALSIPLQYMGWDIKAVVNAVLKKP